MSTISKNTINDNKSQKTENFIGLSTVNGMPIQTQINPMPIEKLQTFGITSNEVNKLHECGIFTVEALARSPKKDLLTIKGFNEAKVDKLLRDAVSLVQMGFMPASFMLEKKKELIKISTGSALLDNLLGGGVETGSITEIHGEYRCGKTQLCHTIAVTCQLPVVGGGGEGKCLFIDTEGTFRPQRLVDIALRFGMNPQDCLNNVAYARAYNTDHQTQLLISAAGIISESRFSLIIVDSATSLYRSDFNGRSELNARQTHLGKFLRALQKLADEFGVAVLVTNQVVAANLDNCYTFASSSVKPIGGNIMAHAATTRLSMTKSKGSTRKIKVVASPSLPEKSCEINISDGGIQDTYL